MAATASTNHELYNDPRQRARSRSGSPASLSLQRQNNHHRTSTMMNRKKSLLREPSSFAMGSNHSRSSSTSPTRNSCPYPTLPTAPTDASSGLRSSTSFSSSLQRALGSNSGSATDSGSGTGRRSRGHNSDGNHGPGSESSLKRALSGQSTTSSSGSPTASASTSRPRRRRGGRPGTVQSFPMNAPRSIKNKPSSSSSSSSPTREPSAFATSSKMQERSSFGSLSNSSTDVVGDKNHSNHTCSTRSCSVSPTTIPADYYHDQEQISYSQLRKTSMNSSNTKTPASLASCRSSFPHDEKQLYVGVPSSTAAAANNNTEQTCTTFEDVTRIAPRYGMELFSSANPSSRRAKTFLPLCGGVEMNEMEVSPGVSLPFRGVQETWEAVANQDTIQTTCMDCGIDLISVRDCEYVVCPDCRMVNPILLSGVGMGLKKEWVDDAKKIGRHPMAA